MTVKELVLDHLTYTFEKESWQPPLAAAIAGLTAAQAAWKPAPERHSIWQIVRHVTHWKHSVIQAWDGPAPDLKDFEPTDWQEAAGDEAAWQADVSALHAVSQDMRKRVEAADDGALSGLMTTFAGWPDQVKAAHLMKVATHDIYHAGQIQYLRALQGI